MFRTRNGKKCSQTCRMFKLVTIYFPHGERIHILHTQSVLATFGGKKLTFVFTTIVSHQFDTAWKAHAKPEAVKTCHYYNLQLHKYIMILFKIT